MQDSERQDRWRGATGVRTRTDGRGRTNGRQARLKLRRRRRPNQPINRFATSPPPFIRCTAGYNGIEAEAYITDVSDTSLRIPTSSLGILFCSRAENPLWLISDICLQETKWAFVRPSTPSCSRICLHEVRFWKLGWEINVTSNTELISFTLLRRSPTPIIWARSISTLSPVKLWLPL